LLNTVSSTTAITTHSRMFLVKSFNARSSEKKKWNQMNTMHAFDRSMWWVFQTLHHLPASSQQVHLGTAGP
jgi:hypothetical protein